MSQNPNYNTIPGSSSGQLPGGATGVFQVVMPQSVLSQGMGHAQQVIHIGPSGVRTLTPTGGVPQVRVLERQSSGQFRVVGGTSGGLHVVESPVMKTASTDSGGLPQEVHLMSGSGPQVIRVPSSQGTNAYRIRVVTGDENQTTPGHRMYYQASAPQISCTTPTSTYTLSYGSRMDSPDGRRQGQFQYPQKIHLSNAGRSSSSDNLGNRFAMSCSEGSTTYGGGTPSGTVYSTGPRGLTFSISSSGVQPVNQVQQQEQQQQQQQQQQQAVYDRGEYDQDRRSSSPQVHVIRIQEAGNSKRQQSPGSFDDIVQRKLSNFIMGQNPQYLFRHRPHSQRQTDPGRSAYILMSRPRRCRVAPRRGSLDSSTSDVTPGKKIVRTTREEIRNIGDGQTQTIREVSEELVDDDGRTYPVQPDVIPVYSTTAVGANDFETFKSTGSNDSGSGSGSGDRNIFNRFRFKFNSIGNGWSDSRESTASKEALRFEDFDDMVGHISQLKAPILKAASNHVASDDDICPYCNSENPDCEYTCHHKCRQLVALDCAGISPDRRNGERVSRNRTETSLSEDHSKVDDADSGYHTGSSTLQSRGQRIVNKSPGQWTLTREELRRNIEVFNNNNHGLIMSLQPDTNTFQGFIRVHMNLIRPINMSLSTRPPSIYDVIGQGEEEDDGDDDSQITSFYLPKDTTKVIHINSDTTTQEVIKTLLSKFKITDNPRKFALYEKIQERKNATMRRLEDDEMPLPLCLCWTKDGVDGLDKRKFVLQENDTGEIMWEAFSLPELENFLKILNREEEEYVEQVRDKYRMLKIHMERRLKELGPPEATLSNDKRTPVFV